MCVMDDVPAFAGAGCGGLCVCWDLLVLFFNFFSVWLLGVAQVWLLVSGAFGGCFHLDDGLGGGLLWGE